MLSEFFREKKNGTPHSYGGILQSAFFTYATMELPHTPEPTPQEKEVLSKIKLTDLTKENVKTMKTNTLVHIHKRTSYLPWYTIPQIVIWGAGFIVLTYTVSHKVQKNPVKYFGSHTKSYKQVLIRGTILSSIYSFYLLGGGLAIFYPHHPIMKMNQTSIIENEINERNCLYGEKARKELLENTLRFYQFEEEYIDKTMNMVDINLKSLRDIHE